VRKQQALATKYSDLSAKEMANNATRFPSFSTEHDSILWMEFWQLYGRYKRINKSVEHVGRNVGGSVGSTGSLEALPRWVGTQPSTEFLPAMFLFRDGLANGSKQGKKAPKSSQHSKQGEKVDCVKDIMEDLLRGTGNSVSKRKLF